jgi:hypothetical protein
MLRETMYFELNCKKCNFYFNKGLRIVQLLGFGISFKFVRLYLFCQCIGTKYLSVSLTFNSVFILVKGVTLHHK